MVLRTVSKWYTTYFLSPLEDFLKLTNWKQAAICLMGPVELWPSTNFVLFRLELLLKLSRIHALNGEREEGVVVVDQRYTVAKGFLVLLLIHLWTWNLTSSYAPLSKTRC